MAGITLLDKSFEALAEGALWWPEERLLAVADLHLEKGSAFARRRQFLPPYDTAATLAALSRLIMRIKPRIVVALGDSFHDCDGVRRLGVSDHEEIGRLQAGRQWIWIAGNHDPDLPDVLAGEHAQSLEIGGIVFRHEPAVGARGEIAGHLHPAARISGRLGSTRRRCFVADGRRLVLPAFGAYAGGLNVLEEPFQPLFPNGLMQAFLVGLKGIYPVASRRLRPD